MNTRVDPRWKTPTRSLGVIVPLAIPIGLLATHNTMLMTIVDVASKGALAAKVVGSSLVLNLVGLAIYRKGGAASGADEAIT